jgi:hypothetical protein
MLPFACFGLLLLLDSTYWFPLSISVLCFYIASATLQLTCPSREWLPSTICAIRKAVIAVFNDVIKSFSSSICLYCADAWPWHSQSKDEHSLSFASSRHLLSFWSAAVDSWDFCPFWNSERNYKRLEVTFSASLSNSQTVGSNPARSGSKGCHKPSHFEYRTCPSQALKQIRFYITRPGALAGLIYLCGRPALILPQNDPEA